jgi:hypothetical protein
VRFGELFGRREGLGDRLAHLATAFNDFDKRWAVSQTLAIIAGRAAMKEERGWQNKSLGHAKDISE